MTSKLALVLAVGCSLALSSRAALSPDQVKALPPPANHRVDFATEVKPIFEATCIRCHGRGRDRGGLRIDSRDTLLKGGDSGPAAIAGKSADSYLIALVSGADPDEVMPKKGKKLTPEEIGLLRAWIDQGLSWNPEIGFGPIPPMNLDPRSPEVPEPGIEINPVDRFLDVYFQEHNVTPPPPVSDRIFARRAYLDAIGLLPPARELTAFVSSRKADKRRALVRDLLSRQDAYAQNWLTFWNDLLRNDYKGTGYIDGGREQITQWLYAALLTNMPYDQFVAELVNPGTESEGFTKGIVWRGTVNASQMPQMQAAQNISQVFMGLNLKCASCHDSFINDWQLSDAYGFANVFSDQPLEIYRCDVPTGQQAATKFLFPQLGEIHATTNKAERLGDLARVLTCPKDGRLTRTIVNRLWARLLGRGLIEPVDDMQQTAWDQDLLDWLAGDLAAHHYDLKQTMERIMTSRAYQMPAVDLGESQGTNYVFAGPDVRRLSAEEFRDVLASLTGAGYTSADADIGVGDQARQEFGPKKTAQWIWNDPHAADTAKAGDIYARKTVHLSATSEEAVALVVCDNSFELFVNGHKAGAGNDYSKPFMIDMYRWLKRGDNVIAVHAINTPAAQGANNPAGLYIYARVRARAGKKVMDFVSDASWVVTDRELAGWEQPRFVATDWTAASALGAGAIQPWRLRRDLIAIRFAALHPGAVRAALVAADPLMTAMGRPNREQVVTTRPTEATTLQALELINGKTLAGTLKLGAAGMVKQNVSERKLVRSIYQEAVGREPTPEELKTAEGLLGKKPGQDGIEDFLWAMLMLPEFQLIY
jgi:mono/diheme cytochrome c family protein